MRPVLIEARQIMGGRPLRLARGDLVAILGPPGAASGLLRLLGFLERPASGDLLWQGRLVTGLPPGALPVVLLERPARLEIPPGCELLLLDEPARDLMPGLLPLAEGGLAILVATADPEVAVWCRIIYRIKDGVVARMYSATSTL